MGDIRCGKCEHFKECELELGVSDYLLEQSVIGCKRGDGRKNIPKVNEEGEEHEKNETW